MTRGPPRGGPSSQFDAERWAQRVADLVEQRTHAPVAEKLDQLSSGLSRLGEQVARLDRGQLHIISDVQEAQMHVSELRQLVGLTDESKARLATELAAEATGAAVGAALSSVPPPPRPILDVEQLRDRFWNLKTFRNVVGAGATTVAFFKLVVPLVSFLCRVASSELIHLIRRILGPIAGGDA